jgi:hypothetical protein
MLTPEEIDQKLTALETDMNLLVKENLRLIEERESAYVELDSWVSLLAKLAAAKDLVVGLVNATTVAIELPSGVVTWEFAESEAHLYEALPNYAKPLEVIDRKENYIRIMNPGF